LGKEKVRGKKRWASRHKVALTDKEGKGGEKGEKREKGKRRKRNEGGRQRDTSRGSGGY